MGHQRSGRRKSKRQQVRRRPLEAAVANDPELVLAVDVQHRQTGREGRPPRHQARSELRREFRARLDPRRAHGGGILFRGALNAAAAPDRADGLALRPDAADELGRRARSRRARDRRGHRRAGRGRAVRLGVRSRRRRRRLREHLGHRKALFRRDEDQEHPDSQSPRLQFGGARHARHGGRRTQQLLRGRGTRRHDRRRRHQSARDPDQLLPQPLDPEPSGGVARQEEEAHAG